MYSARAGAYQLGERRIISKNDIHPPFWGHERWKRDLPPFQRHLSLSAEESTTEVSPGRAQNGASPAVTLSIIAVSVISSISLVPAEGWDACAIDASGVEAFNPFILHDFLLSLGESKSAAPEERMAATAPGSTRRYRKCAGSCSFCTSNVN